MSVVWKINYQGTVKTVGEWGFALPRITRKNQDIDVLTLKVAPKDAALDAALFAEGQHITLLRNDGTDGAPDVQWFVGRVDSVDRDGQALSQAMTYTVVGLWWYAEHTIYQQSWEVVTFTDPTNPQNNNGAETIYTDHLMLNRGLSNAVWTVREQIDDALTYLNAAYRAATGASVDLFQWDEAEFPDVFLPWEEARSITVAEVIRRQLRWFIDVMYVDYSTSPATIHCLSYNAIAADAARLRTYTIGDGKAEGFQFRPRYDLLVPEVVLRYEYNGTLNGVACGGLVITKAPSNATGMKPLAIVQTIDMKGASINTISQPIESKLIQAEAAGSAYTDYQDQLAWWIEHMPELADPADPTAINPSIVIPAGANPKPVKFDNVSVPNIITGTFVGPGGQIFSEWVLAHELKKGAIASWMWYPQTGGPAMSVHSKECVISADVSYSLKDPQNAGQARWIGKKQVKIKIVATDAMTSTFGTTSSSTPPEPYPADLAQQLLDSYSVLQWEGELSYVEREVSGAIALGHVVNVAEGLPAWATMKACVQTVTEDHEEGRTIISTGPPKHLGTQDFLEMFRANRWRMTWTNPALRAGTAGSTGATEVGGATNRENTVGETASSRRMVFSDPDYTPAIP